LEVVNVSELKYSKNIVTDTKPYTPKEIEMQKEMMKKSPVKSTVRLMRLLWMDETMVPGASMYMECCWLWGGETTSGTMEEPHMHEDFDEVIGFIGTDKENPGELNGMMEMNIGDEIHYLTRSCLMHIPAGMKHCPLTFKKVTRPIFFFTLAPKGMYGRRREEGAKPAAPPRAAFVPPPKDASGSRYARYILTEPVNKGFPEIPVQPYAEVTRVVTMNNEISKGAMYADFVWIWKGSTTLIPQTQALDVDEMIGIAGTFDPDHPRELGGEVEMAIGDEKHKLDKSSLVFLPKGLKHGPLVFKNVEKPILLFTLRNK
jgi:hypothetical protein